MDARKFRFRGGQELVHTECALETRGRKPAHNEWVFRLQRRMLTPGSESHTSTSTG